jgi:hypothetical protein
MIGQGYVDVDFAALLEVEARGAGYEITAEDVEVRDGLEPLDAVPASAS